MSERTGASDPTEPPAATKASGGAAEGGEPAAKGRLRVWVLKEQIRPERLEGATVIVIDVFMATTTLVSILDCGARAIYPVGTLEDAEIRWDELEPSLRLRGGEQMAEPVPGWDCGPYPHEYPASRVRGRDVLYISTNGTAAIARAADTAERLFVCSVRNAPATARHLERIGADSIYVICAGSLGRLALDDLAGAACLLSHMDPEGWSLNDGARLAWDLAERYGDRIPELLGRARSGRWFHENGKTEEFDFVADVGASEVVAELLDGRLVRVDEEAPKSGSSDGTDGKMGDGGGGRTIPVRPGEELDWERIHGFLRDALPEIPEGELGVRQFSTGSSNLTYLLSIGDWKGVLRRPPFGPVPPKAHDMMREAGILEKLHPAFPLAPRSLLRCDDPSVMDAPFHVMEYREGAVIVEEFPPDVEETEDLCGRVADTILDTLLQLHDVDYVAAGLGDIGHPEGFLERQVRGWIGRYEGSTTDESPDVDHLTGWLADNVPESPPPTIIHNDYHVKNLLFAPGDPTRLHAVLDWEMATVGDPLMDFAVHLSYWVEADDPPELKKIFATVTTKPGFPARNEMMERYGRRSGRDLSAMGWYLPFAYFKLAVILQQIYARWVRGQTEDSRFASFGGAIRQIVRHAEELVRERA